MVRKVLLNSRPKSHLSKEQLAEYKQMMADAHTLRFTDPRAFGELKSKARSFLKRCKADSWRSYINDCAENRRHFRVANLIMNKGSVYHNRKRANLNKSKVPTIDTDLETTKRKWKEH